MCVPLGCHNEEPREDALNMEAVQCAQEGQVAHVVSVVRQEEYHSVVVVDAPEIICEIIVDKCDNACCDLVTLCELQKAEARDVMKLSVEGLPVFKHYLVCPFP